MIKKYIIAVLLFIFLSSANIANAMMTGDVTIGLYDDFDYVIRQHDNPMPNFGAVIPPGLCDDIFTVGAVSTAVGAPIVFGGLMAGAIIADVIRDKYFKSEVKKVD